MGVARHSREGVSEGAAEEGRALRRTAAEEHELLRRVLAAEVVEGVGLKQAEVQALGHRLGRGGRGVLG